MSLPIALLTRSAFGTINFQLSRAVEITVIEGAIICREALIRERKTDARTKLAPALGEETRKEKRKMAENGKSTTNLKR